MYNYNSSLSKERKTMTTTRLLKSRYFDDLKTIASYRIIFFGSSFRILLGLRSSLHSLFIFSQQQPRSEGLAIIREVRLLRDLPRLVSKP